MIPVLPLVFGCTTATPGDVAQRYVELRSAGRLQEARDLVVQADQDRVAVDPSGSDVVVTVDKEVITDHLALVHLTVARDGSSETMSLELREEHGRWSVILPPQRPNILLVTLDTLRADALPFYGNKETRTPVMRQLAKDSVRFSRAFTVTPLTIPAHSSLFTGLYPPRHGVRDNGDHFLSDEAITLAEHLQGAGYATMASVGAEVTSRHWGFAQGFDAYFDDMAAERQSAQSRWRVERPGAEVIEDALDWLEPRLANPSDPWFAWVHMFDCHAPYEAPDAFAVLHPDRPYLAEVEYTDLQVGRLLATLEASGTLEDTWVVVLSDHGEGLGTHGEMQHGVLLYNATTRIPLIVRPPGGAEDARVHFPVSTVDVMPTLLGIAGVDPSDVPIDGLDLQPWLDDPERAAPPDREVYVESLYAYRHYGWAPQRALVSEGHKLIDSTTPELYERADVFDADDLAPKEPRRVEAMQASLGTLSAGLTPVKAMRSDADLSPERVAQLEALGYMVQSVDHDDGELPTGLPDPVSRLDVLRDVEVGRASMRIGDIDGAVEALTKVLAEEPGLVEPRLLLADTLRRSGKIEEAIQQAKIAHENSPGSMSFATLASLEIHRGNLEAGLALYRQALETDPYQPQIWTPFLQTLIMSGNIPGLREETPKAVKAVPDASIVELAQGHLALADNDLNRAETLLLSALERAPKLPLTRHALGIIHRSRGDADAAETMFLEELTVGDAMPPRRMLVEIYVEQHRYAEQLAQLEAIIAMVPEDILTRHAITQALFNLARYDEALDASETCLEQAPTHAYCMLLKANTLKKLGREEEGLRALALAKQFRERAPGPPPTTP